MTTQDGTHIDTHSGGHDARQSATSPGPRIGELAADVGFTAKTIRYYEQIGLLPPPQRTQAGHRLYGAADRERLRFIRKAKAVGLTLGEIQDLIAIRQRGEAPCDHVRAVITRKLTSIEQQMQLLAAFREELLALQHEAATGRDDQTTFCRIIEHHEPLSRGGMARPSEAPGGVTSSAERVIRALS